MPTFKIATLHECVQRRRQRRQQQQQQQRNTGSKFEVRKIYASPVMGAKRRIYANDEYALSNLHEFLIFIGDFCFFHLIFFSSRNLMRKSQNTNQLTYKINCAFGYHLNNGLNMLQFLTTDNFATNSTKYLELVFVAQSIYLCLPVAQLSIYTESDI